MNTVTETASRDEVWQHLSQGILNDELPGPKTMDTSTAQIALVRLADVSAMHRWVKWLDAGPVGSEQYRDSMWRLIDHQWAERAWRGWTIRLECHQRIQAGVS